MKYSTIVLEDNVNIKIYYKKREAFKNGKFCGCI